MESGKSIESISKESMGRMGREGPVRSGPEAAQGQPSGAGLDQNDQWNSFQKKPCSPLSLAGAASAALGAAAG